MGQPDRAEVVIVGGGVVGCSTAYHLAERGRTDVVVLERSTLTSGTTWHAAGLITQARPTAGGREIVRRSLATFKELERRHEAGVGTSPGFVGTGTIHLATNEPRWEELRRMASAGRGSGQHIEVINPDRILELFPLVDPAGLIGGLYYPDDARGTATDTTAALAQAARQAGATVLEHTPVLDVITEGRRVVGVRTEAGVIETDHVVNCTGMWGRQFGQQAGVDLPLQALTHYYVVTEAIPGLGRDLPTVKSSDEWSYVKNEGDGLMVGFFEPGATPWEPRGIPMDVDFVTLPEDWDHLAPFYERMVDRVPALGEVGIRLCFNGPESFTPDGHYHLGRVLGLDNYFAACGFNSIGFLSGPGAGDVLAEWIIDGEAPIDLAEADPRRVSPHQVNRRYLEQRVVETLDKAYAIHWPFEQRETARGIKRSPLHDRGAAAGAVFGEVAGWERANWYAPPGQAAAYDYGFGRTEWFAAWAAEHQAVRAGVGLFDLSSFGKIAVAGPDALALLQELSVSDIDVAVGRVVYTQWLNQGGGIEADVTVTRQDVDEFMVMTATGTLRRDLDRLLAHVDGRAVVVTDVSGTYAMLAVMGPQSRALLQPLTDADLSHAGFAFGTSRSIDLGHTFVRATRLSFVGELGWELLVPVESAVHVYDTIVEAGAEHGLVHAGYHTLDSMRLEKGYRSWGHDIGWLDSPDEAGLGFTVAWDKPAGFMGRDAALARRDAHTRSEEAVRRLVHVEFEDPDVFAYHDEPLYRAGELIGTVAAASYAHCLGRAVALAWVTGPAPIDDSWLSAEPVEAEVACERTPVRLALTSSFDPRSERMRQ